MDTVNRRGSWGGLDQSEVVAGPSGRRGSDSSHTNSEKESIIAAMPTEPKKCMDRRCSWGDLDSMMEDLLLAAGSAESELEAIEECPEERFGASMSSIRRKPSSSRRGDSPSNNKSDKKKKSRKAELRKKISRVRSMDRA